MTNSKTTKRALLSSAFAMLVCVAMLIGTTFAWFTDTASTGVNKIQAGNLDITVEYAKEKMNDDGTLAGELTDWAPIDNATNVFDPNALWEPGRTEYVVFRITNNGNLALKYKLSLETLAQKPGTNKANEQFYLADYLCASAKVDVGPGEIGSGVSSLGAFMTKLNDLGVAGVQNVFDPEYHPLTDATVNGTLLPGKTNCVPMAIWMQTTVGNEANAISPDKAATIDFGINVVATQDTVEKDSFGSTYDNDAKYPSVEPTVYDGGTATIDFNSKADGGWGVIQAKNGANLTIKGDAVAIESKDHYAMAVYAVGTGTRVTIEGGLFTQEITGSDNQYDLIYAAEGAQIEITGGTFKIGAGDPKWTLNCKDNSGSKITVKGGTFYKFDPSAVRTGQAEEVVVPTGYKVVRNGDWYTVVAE